jgi:hypothetical protein
MNRRPATSSLKAALWTLFAFALLAALSLVGPLRSADAGFTTAGEVVPSDPATWTLSTTAYVGMTSGGTVTVDGGSDL